MVSSLNVATISLGIVGMAANAMLFSVIRKDKRKKSLFQITIFSLGVADFLVSLILVYSGIYFTCQEMKIFEVSQQFLEIFLANLTFCQTSSFLHVLLITIERLVAVFYPLKFRHVFTRKVCVTALIFVWTAPLPLCFVQHHKIRLVFKPVAFVSGIFLIGSYTAIYIQLSRRSKSVIVRASSEKSSTTFRIAAHALFVTFAFLICTLPYLLAKEGEDSFTGTARLLMVSNVLLNPVFYVLFAHCKETVRNQSFISFRKGRKQTEAIRSSREVPSKSNAMADVAAKDGDNKSREKVELGSIETEDTQYSTN